MNANLNVKLIDLKELTHIVSLDANDRMVLQWEHGSKTKSVVRTTAPLLNTGSRRTKYYTLPYSKGL